MKKLILLLITVTLITTSSCKNDKTEAVHVVKTKHTKTYSVIGETSVVKWIAYKTTDKLPVKGKFDTIKITNTKAAANIEDALNGIIFSIPVSSLITDDSERDTKLKEFFFGVMKNTEFISGTFDIKGKSSHVNITMNGISKSIPIELNIEGQTVTFSNTLNLNDWDLKLAIESLNKACNLLHKGSDGISKTWDEIEIKTVIYLKVND